MKLAPAYSPAVASASLQQIVVLVLAALMLDGGATLRSCFLAALGHWAAILLILARRPASPTPWDLFGIRYGFWLAIVLMMLLTPFVLRATGVSP